MYFLGFGLFVNILDLRTKKKQKKKVKKINEGRGISVKLDYRKISLIMFLKLSYVEKYVHVLLIAYMYFSLFF
jgi:hypothetical protein